MAKMNERGRTGQALVVKECYVEVEGGGEMVSIPFVAAFIR